MRKIKTWEELRIDDNFIFSKVMRDERICRIVIEKLLGFNIREIRFIDYEKVIEEGRESKGIRLDIFFKDDDKKISLEMQNADTLNLPKRSRYYICLERDFRFMLLKIVV